MAKSYVTLSVFHSVWLIALATRVASYTGIGLTSHSNHELNLYSVRTLFMRRVSYENFLGRRKCRCVQRVCARVGAPTRVV